MKVYYNSSLWSIDKGIRGLPFKINWKFEYAGAKRCIPVVYRFPKGIVFDIITFLDEARLRDFFEKYEAVEEKLTPLEKQCAKQEHPYQSVPIKKIWIDGQRVEEGYSSRGALSIPWASQRDDLTHVRKTYSHLLKDTSCFACQRYCVPYPETGSIIQKLLRILRLNKIKQIKLSTHSVQRFHPLNIHFVVAEKGNSNLVRFNHPITGETHTLYFQNTKLVEMPLGVDVKDSVYITHSMYEIEPALPKGDSLQFNNSIQYIQPQVDKLNPTAASVGIIGGADGPTSICVSPGGKATYIQRGQHGLPLYNCFSVPSFQKDDASNFVLQGINTQKDDSKEYEFYQDGKA